MAKTGALALGAGLALTVGLGLAGMAGAAEPADQAAVSQALASSAQAWTKGDLDGFMQSYEPGDATTYLNKDGPVRGYRAIHDMYAARFGAGQGLGVLSLELLDFRLLGPGYALATGRFHLDRTASGGGASTGLFTLVFHKADGRWRIISDHTS